MNIVKDERKLQAKEAKNVLVKIIFGSLFQFNSLLSKLQKMNF